MSKVELPRNVSRRRDRNLVRARVQVDGKRVVLGDWPDTVEGIAAAANAVKEATRAVEDGVWAPPSVLTFADYAERWLERRQRAVTLGEIRRSTYLGDEEILTSRILPRLGKIKLSNLGRDDVEVFAVDLLENGRKSGGGLAPQTVRGALKVLRKILNAAIDEELIARDPSRGVRVDTPTSSIDADFDNLKTWRASELGWFIGEIGGMDRQMIALAAATGIRRSELCGLRWANADLDAGLIRIRSTVTMERNIPVFANAVKSIKSRRSIAMDPAVVTLLRERRADQNRQRLATGGDWHDPYGLVFTWDDGRLVSPEWFTKRIQALARVHGLEPIGAHGLRHTFATISLENGVPLKTVSEALGHADIGVTADVYSHVTEDVARRAAEIVGAAIFGTAT